MCTVVFIPYESKFYLASLRDEDPKRAIAHKPVISLSDHQKYIAPFDPQGGGTWVGISEFGFVIVLLNGGFINHTKKGPYAKSRGQIVKELLSLENPIVGWLTNKLNNIEPFTLIVWSGSELWHLVWDGDNKYQDKIDPTKAHIWSSATLYNETVKQYREQAFDKWITGAIIKDRSTLFDFFKQTVNSKESLFIKDGLAIKTLSYTFIEMNATSYNSFTYHDLSTDLISTISMTNNKTNHIGIIQ